MKLEHQVCSLELAKRLKELGVKQESLFCWYWHKWPEHPNSWPGPVKPADGFELIIGRPSGTYIEDVWQGGEMYSAFTVSELGEMLPEKIGDYAGWCCGRDGAEFKIAYVALDAGVLAPELGAATEADARAKMLIYLIEQGLVKI